MRLRTIAVLCVAAAMAATGAHLLAQSAGNSAPADDKGQKPAKVILVVFDFVGEGEAGKKFADSLRLKFARNAGDKFEVLDQLTTQESSQPTGVDAKAADVQALMKDPFSASVGIMGNVTQQGDGLKAEVRCIDLRPAQKAAGRRRSRTRRSGRCRSSRQPSPRRSSAASSGSRRRWALSRNPSISASRRTSTATSRTAASAGPAPTTSARSSSVTPPGTARLCE